MNIAFIGMMGTGKSTVGKEVAERLLLAFADIDNIIIAREGMSIEQVFITNGEKMFRDEETSVLREYVWQENMAISCGGGIVLKQENMDLLKGYIKVRLVCGDDEIYARIKDDVTRPLVKDNTLASIKRISAEREPLYARYADITVDTSGLSVKAAADLVMQQLEKLPYNTAK